MTSETPESEEPTKRPWLRRVFIASQILLGLGLGLALTEYAFAKRAQGAFPHVNFYVADDALGVRLRPGASMRLAIHDNPVSTITVNSAGYRGPEWPPAGEQDDEILVLGDSQVFGLGVDDDATFSAGLAAATGRTVINAGVPTYGPSEYLQVTAELLEARGSKTVVYVLNYLNDPFELERPNTGRHVVWDGWAVRYESAPEPDSSYAFPGRAWLMAESHAMYAARRWWYARREGDEESTVQPELGFVSEGSWDALISAGERSDAHIREIHTAAEREAAERRASLVALDAELDETEKNLTERSLGRAERELRREYRTVGWELGEGWNQTRKTYTGKLGDILEGEFFESSRLPVVTAEQVHAAASYRRQHIREAVEAELRQGEHSETQDLAETEQRLVQERQLLLDAIVRERVEATRIPSVFAPHFAELAALCEAHGAELLVVALPMDVQVDPREWAKYGLPEDQAPPDLEPSLALIRDLIASAEALGAGALDLTETLRAAEPGAFLDGDIHMTAKGHAAVSAAIAEALTHLDDPPRLRPPAPGLPPGRTALPSHRAWIEAPHRDVWGKVGGRWKRHTDCMAREIDEWVHIRCTDPGVFHVERLDGGDLEETLIRYNRFGATLVFPMPKSEAQTEAEPVRLRLVAKNSSHRTIDFEITVHWEPNEKGEPRRKFRSLDYEAPEGQETPQSARGESDRRLEACTLELYGTKQKKCLAHQDAPRYAYDLPENAEMCEASMSETWGAASPACLEAYADDCAKLLACAQGDPLVVPACPEGEVKAYATWSCFAPCDANHPCAEGRCVAYNDGGLCR